MTTRSVAWPAGGGRGHTSYIPEPRATHATTAESARVGGSSQDGASRALVTYPPPAQHHCSLLGVVSASGQPQRPPVRAPVAINAIRKLGWPQRPGGSILLALRWRGASPVPGPARPVRCCNQIARWRASPIALHPALRPRQSCDTDGGASVRLRCAHAIRRVGQLFRVVVVVVFLLFFPFLSFSFW